MKTAPVAALAQTQGCVAPPINAEALQDVVPRRVLFTDIEGVLVPTRPSSLLPSPLDLLLGWLAEHTDVAVVLTTRWREHFPLQELAEMFKPLHERVVGATTALPAWYAVAMSKPARQAEIERWLDLNAPDASWVALDSQPARFPPNHPRLVLCLAALGVQQAQLRVVEHRFGIRPN